MPDPSAGRRAELIAAAAAADLNPAERAELDALRAEDPTIDAEISELLSAIDVLGSLREVRADDIGTADMRTADMRWDDGTPSAGLRDRVVAIQREPETPVRGLVPRRRWVVGLGVAACVLAGAGLGLGASGLLAPGSDGPRPGAPGSLGALEHVDFGGEPDGVSIDGSLVAHTWGTETILEIDGLSAGDAFTVVLVGADGEEFDSGSFLGSTVRIDCRMNAAVDRPDVETVEIRDAGGDVVATADLPAVDA